MAGTRSAVTRAKALANQINATPIDLAEALWEAEQAKPGSVRRMIEDGATRLKYRRARYLLNVWDRFAGLNEPRDILVNAGWTKLALIARYSEPGVEEGWLELAQPGRSTAKQLEDQLKGHSADKPKGHSILLRLSPAQHRTFVKVLLKFGAKPARNGKGLAGKERALAKALADAAAD
jgi:hypothetical protein